MKRGKLTPMTVITDGLLLFFALTGVVFSVLTAYGLKADHRALLLGCGILSLSWLTILSLPKFKLPFTLAALGLWGWGMWKLWEPLLLGEASVWCGVVNTAARKIPAITAIEPIAQLPAEVWPLCTTLWLLMVAVGYALALAFLLIWVRRALPVFLLTLLPILPAVCVTEAPHPIPMAGLVVVWMTLFLTSHAESRDPAGAARLRLPAFLGAWACLFALFALSGLETAPGPHQPDWAAQARADAYNAANRLDLSAILTRFDFLGWKGSGSTQYVSLTGGGAARTGRTALEVQTTSYGKHYLRGYSADVYTGTRWEPLSRADRRELEDILKGSGFSPLLTLGEKAKHSAGYAPYYSSLFIPVTGRDSLTNPSAAMTVKNVSAPGGCAYYPYALESVPEGAALGGDSHLARQGQTWEHTYTFQSQWEDINFFYQVGLFPEDDGIPEESLAAQDAYRDFVYDHYLQVPEDTRQALLDWVGTNLEGLRSPEDYAKVMKWFRRVWEEGDTVYGGIASDWTQEEVTPEEVDAVRTQYTFTLCDTITWLLADKTRYNMDTPAPPAGEDYVNWFLNESKEGYCMHYATAGTLLLRAMGVPARYVSGYVVDVPRSGFAVVPDSAAHAWVEVYYDNVGWYPVDFTPGFQGDGTGSLTSSEFTGDGEPVSTAAPAPSAAVTQAPTPSAAPSAAPSQPPKTAAEAPGAATPLPLWPLALLALAAGALLGRYGLLRRRKRKLTQPDTNAAVLWAYRCHQRLLSWGAPDNEALTVLAGKARFSQHILTEEERETALRLLAEALCQTQAALPPWKKPLFYLRWGKNAL